MMNLLFAHDNLVQDHAFLTKEISNGKTKTSESSSHGSIDQSHIVPNACDVGKKHISTSCDDLLDMPCSSQIDACSTSMSMDIGGLSALWWRSVHGPQTLRVGGHRTQ